MNRTSVASFFVSMVAVCAYATDIQVPAGAPHVLTASENVAGNAMILADGAVLSLQEAGSGEFRIACSIDVAEDGTATLDTTGLSGYSGVTMGSTAQSQMIRLRTLGEGGKLIIKGIDGLTFGRSARTEQSINFPRFDADVQFIQADGRSFASPTGVTFINNVLVARVPTSAPYAFADDVIVAMIGENPLGLTETLAPQNWDLYGPTYPEGGIPRTSEITIGSGRKFYVRGVSASSYESNWGRWAGMVRNDIVINGTLRHEQTDWVTYSGAVTGSGEINAVGGVSDVKFTGSVDFDGKFGLDTIRTAQFTKDATIGSLTACEGHTLVICGAMNIGTLSGNLILTDASTGTLHIATLAAGATVSVPESVAVRIDATEDEAAGVTLSGSGSFALAGPSAGLNKVTFDVDYPEGNIQLTLGGKIAFTEPFPATVAGVTLAADCEWSPTPKADEPWEGKVGFWIDPTVASSVVMAKDYSRFAEQSETCYYRNGDTSGSPLIYTIGDCRGESGSRLYLRNERVAADPASFVNYGTTMLPALSVGKVNDSGKSYMALETSSAAASFVTNNPARTAMYATTFKAEYAIVVFGSQVGGGKAMLANASGAFDRDGLGNTAAKAEQYCIATNAFETYVDGTAVNPTTTGFSAGWQIISMKTDGKSVSGLAFTPTYTSNRGYANYAEVMLFSEVPTERQRMAIEKYLSDKWDISISHKGPEPLEQELTLTGTGTVSLSANTTVHGSFSGNIHVNGFALTVANDGNLRDATPHGTGSITAGTHRQLPRSKNLGGFSGELNPPPDGLMLILR